MDKKTETWLTLAENDLEFAGQILANKQRPYYACHQCHQAVEKILKAVVQHKTGQIPPRTHNLKTLAELAKVELPSEQDTFLLKLSAHYIGTRYPDDLSQFYKAYTVEHAKEIFEKTRGLFLWLKNCLI